MRTSRRFREIAAARDQLADLQRQLAEQLKRAIEAAEHEKSRKHGWFSRTFGDVIDTVAKIFAKHVELLKDVVVLPAAVFVSLATEFNNREALVASLRRDLGELSDSSKTERAVAGFVSGTARFTGDLLAFELVVLTAIAANAARGEMPISHPTQCNLHDLHAALQRHGSLTAFLDAEAARRVCPIVPKMFREADHSVIVMPWDATYEASPGEGPGLTAGECGALAELPSRVIV